ncbi:universal stress protein [Synechococcus sp. CCY 9618]|uniref:universal stress protein n=1 Tax=Synechococcus sp. CCY 9618 TaxID=2815602 RepID=UPI001C226A07|nr:universal stress protein [Synechococcus sp. CCY 9618]
MSYRHLLVPSDGSDLSIRAVRHAVELAAALGARITFFHAQASVPVQLVGLGEMLDAVTMEALMSASHKDVERILEDALAVAREAGINADAERVMSDLPHQAIVEAANRLGCDLILMASHGRRGLVGLLIGSETQRVLVQSRCPVLVYR